MNNIEYMNELGNNNIPFLFIFDFHKENIIVKKIPDIDSNEILYNIKGTNNYYNESKLIKKIKFEKYPVSYSEYLKAFNIVHQNLKYGNSYLCNLTMETPIKLNLDLKEIFYYSNATYKLYYKNIFTVFSPETFVEIKNGKIYSHPMKGTIDAGIPNAEKVILNDKKEMAEHYTIVDLIRNDLSIVSKNVKVERFRYITKLKTNQKNLLQVSSEISGELDKNYNKKIGSIIYKLLPAGSISGAPKEKTFEIIQQSENYKRGFYTGIFGIFDGVNLDSAVMIRYIENKDGGYFFKSGGGITFKSNPKDEYQELIDKIYVPIT